MGCLLALPRTPGRTPALTPPPQVLSPAAGEVVVGDLTHPLVPKTQRRATRGWGKGGQEMFSGNMEATMVM